VLAAAVSASYRQNH